MKLCKVTSIQYIREGRKIYRSYRSRRLSKNVNIKYDKRSTRRHTWIAEKLRTSTRVVNSSTVESTPFASSINQDRKSFCEKVSGRESQLQTRSTHRLICPLFSVLIQAFLTFLDYRANKPPCTFVAMGKSRHEPSNQTVIVVKNGNIHEKCD